ncbi:MAG: alpha/beta hydrolase-fold protein [Opitutaceae bacterium]|nr:alpha/beta hydrolase-fold protein [Opitutaceae bacterium]
MRQPPAFVLLALLFVLPVHALDLGDGALLKERGVEGQVRVFQVGFPGAIGVRDVYVRVPEDYDVAPSRRYPVLYFHDGANLFAAGRAFGGAEWGLDEAMKALVANGRIRDFLVVGVDTSRDRLALLTPQKAREAIRDTEREKRLEEDAAHFGFRLRSATLLSDLYASFVALELKPAIDRAFRTLPDQPNTGIAGSSMGGLASLYAICEFPEVYGFAGCISTHWSIGDGLMLPYLEGGKRLPDPATHRIYFDFGTVGLDAAYEPYQRQVDKMMRERGFTEGANWVTRKYAGAEHSERAWRQRAPEILEYLLK